MKKLLLTMACVLLFAGASLAQALVGFTMSEVRDKNPGVTWGYGRWGESKQFQTMSFEDDYIGVAYYFNEEYRCVGTVIVPKNQGVLQGMIERYNNRYVVVDDNNWKFYTQGGVLRCVLGTTEKGAYYFYWSE